MQEAQSNLFGAPHSPGVIVKGNVVWVGDFRRGRLVRERGVFYRDVRNNLIVDDCWVLEVAVINLLEGGGFRQIEYYNQDEDALYATTIQTFRDHATRQYRNGRDQFFLKRGWWTKGRRVHRVPGAGRQ